MREGLLRADSGARGQCSSAESLDLARVSGLDRGQAAFCLAQTSGKEKASALRADPAGLADREVLEIKHQYDKAQLANDSAWFERMFEDVYLMVLPDSSTLAKARAIAELRSREITWRSATGEDMQVRVYGDTAVVSGRFPGKALTRGQPLNEYQRFTSVAGLRFRLLARVSARPGGSGH